MEGWYSTDTQTHPKEDCQHHRNNHYPLKMESLQVLLGRDKPRDLNLRMSRYAALGDLQGEVRKMVKACNGIIEYLQVAEVVQTIDELVQFTKNLSGGMSVCVCCLFVCLSAVCLSVWSVCCMLLLYTVGWLPLKVIIIMVRSRCGYFG